MKNRYHCFKPLGGATLAIVICLSAAVGISPVALGASSTWDFGAATQDWNTAANWSGDVFPTGNFPDGVATINTIADGEFPIITADSAFTPSDVVVGSGSGSIGRLDHTAGTAATGAANWMFVGVTGGGTGTYNLANTAASGGALSGFGTGSGSMTVGGRLKIGDVGTGAVNVNTSGTLAVGGGAIWAGQGGGTGSLNIDAGTVTVAAGNGTFFGSDAGSVGNFRISGGSFATAGQVQIGQWSGTGSGIQSGGSVTIGGILRVGYGTTNAASGGTGIYELNGGMLQANGGLQIGRYGSGTFNLNGGTLQTQSVGKGGSGAGTATFNFDGGTLTATQDNAAFFGNLTTANVKDGGAVFDTNGFNVTISQPLLGDGTGGLKKEGTGALILGGANTYSGVTSITAGSLVMAADGSIDASSGISLGTTGTFDVTAKAGGYTIQELTGSGNALGGLTISSQLAIGNSTGTVNFDTLTLGAASITVHEVSSGGITADLGNVGGSLSLVDGAILDLVQLGSYTQGDSFTIFAYSEGSLTGLFRDTGKTLLNDGSFFTAAGGLWQIDYDGTVAGVNGGIGDRFVTVTAVPEPAAAGLGGLGLFALLGRRRRQLSAAAGTSSPLLPLVTRA